MAGMKGISRAGLGFNDFAALDTSGADANALADTLHLGVNRTQVHVPAPLADIVGVADIVSKLRPFAAYITCLCHNYSRWIQD
ncbi:MAG: hypothetical protein NVS1B11_13120 [Terriglobales bacterium]